VDSPRSNLTSEQVKQYFEENRCFKCHKIGHRANDPQFHPESASRGRGAPTGGSSNLPSKAGNATFNSGGGTRAFGNGGPIDNGPEEENMALDATSFIPSGSVLPWKEYEDVIGPSSRTWRSKN
jgi:hypothetical protein